ncbi:MAG: heparan-alpha-glucosaminide N-acetyltransferase domain-containing protein [Microbacterium sp.]
MTPVGLAQLDAPGRVRGVDLARGLAVVGMLAAHLLDLPAWQWRDPSTWGGIAAGHSSILFATLAGVSIALVSGGSSWGSAPLPRGLLLPRARGALAMRGILLWLIGLALIATGVPVYVILPAYGLLFLLAAPLLELGARTLWILAAVLALVMPWAQPFLDALPMWQGASGYDLSLALGWHYPFTVWIAFVSAGMAAGRSDLSRLRTQIVLLVVGVALASVVYGADAAIGATLVQEQISYLSAVLTARPHSSGLLEVLGSGGFALAVIALCQLLCRARPVSAVVLPLRAVGSMPLTAYVGQIVAWALVAAVVLGDTGDLTGMRALQPFWAFAVGTIAFCTAWALLIGRGPLEALVMGVTRRALRR